AKWYNAPPKPVLNPEDVGNIEEALANLEAFRQYINPTYADGVAKLVEGRLDERNVNEWKAFFIGGRFAVEMANVLSRQPPGWKDFGKFLNRKTSVGATNYVSIQYSYNPEMLERGQVELSRRLSGGSADTPNLFKASVPDFPNVYLLLIGCRPGAPGSSFYGACESRLYGGGRKAASGIVPAGLLDTDHPILGTRLLRNQTGPYEYRV